MAENRPKTTYRDAGVDIDLKTQALKNVKELVTSTFSPNVLSGIGHFGTLFDMAGLDVKSPVLVSSCDGVGTKIKVAHLAGRHDTVGIDLVNHCTNDILVQGARPLFFLDYLAWGVFDPDMFQELVKGLVEGCHENGLALVGGETAEMPGFYDKGEYDLVGFIVGVTDRSLVVDGTDIKDGDLLIGLESSGFHTNGYSLIRKVLFDMEGMDVKDRPEGLDQTLGEALLAPHLSYLKAVHAIREKCEIKGMAHITGGGMTDNIPRILPEGTAARIRFGTWPVPTIFKLVVGLGGVSSDESLKVFNMGIGFIVVVDPGHENAVLQALEGTGYKPHVIGNVVKGDREVIYENL